MNSIECKCAVFDLDGVVTETAKLHFKAWKATFDEYLERRAEQGDGDFEEFSYEDDYIPFVDGRPRYQGVKAFLESRDIDIPYGRPSDGPETETICGVGNKKNETFRRLVSEEGVSIFDTTLSFIRELRDRGVRVGVASSSKNCGYILEQVGLIDLFDTVVDGNVSRELDLEGKPAPDIFEVAARNMEAEAGESMMVEDSYSGVEAGKNGNFGLVLGVARGAGEEALRAHGADWVVEDMAEISVDDVFEWFRDGISEDGWQLTYHGFEAEAETLREALTTVGNGYFGTRGAFVGTPEVQDIHYPGTYIAGLYNKLPTEVHGKTIYNNDFVNVPNWLLVTVRIGDDPPLTPLDCELLQYRHCLDLKRAIVSRTMRFRDGQGRVTRIATERFAGMDNPHLAALRVWITAENYSEQVRLCSSLDGTVVNDGVPRYRELASDHLSPVSVSESDGVCSLHVETKTSKVKIYFHGKTRVAKGDEAVQPSRSVTTEPGVVTEEYRVDASEGTTYRFEKVVSIFTSKDDNAISPSETGRDLVADAPPYEQLRAAHEEQWAKLWNMSDIVILGDRFSQRAIRLHIYHLLTTASRHNVDIDAGLPARGLHGEAYRGHIFWDEIFIAPFYNLHLPEITKSHLLYRYRRLDQARKNARDSGYEGAMYPWQTADDGTEESQVIHYNPRSGEWDPDLSRNQRHISISIAYNIWAYFYCTYDSAFLYDVGMEMLLEICRFWSSIAEYNEKDDRYHIHGVMGPNEFHEKYPGADEAGYTDNAYTNIMTAWLLHKCLETYEYLPDEVRERLDRRIGFDASELDRWRHIVRRMAVVITDDGIISQFDGWMSLQDLDWEDYRRKYDNIHRLDRILKAEGDSPNRYKVSKQADALQIFYMLAPGQVSNILRLMGYETGDPAEFARKNYEHFVERTSHGSTLSYVVHSAILKYLERHKHDQWKWFIEALRSDICDTQGGTTPEGIHCGVMGGTIDIIVKSFAGINLFKDHINVSPDLPRCWHGLSFRIQHRGNVFEFTVGWEELTVSRLSPERTPMCIRYEGDDYEVRAGERVSIELRRPRTVPCSLPE
jgi:beta-phosphoglucomutase family hydrolase